MYSNSKKRKVRRLLQAALLVGVMAVASQMSSCASPAYYWQAASGHLALMHARQPVDSAIEQGSMDEATTGKLRLSREIKAFAVDHLDLPDNESYTEFVRTGQDAVVWNVIAAPEFSLEAKTWCFPVSGCVPYRGYFEKPKAEQFAEKLEKRDFEVAVSPAIAYSTLGWFDDPLLDTMWNRSDAQFAAYIFHELAHQKLYIKGDTRFNESYASYVELIGVQLWLRERGQHQALESWLALEDAEREFSELLEHTRDELRNIYNSGEQPEVLRTRKQEAFERMNLAYAQLRDESWNGRDYFGTWFNNPPNNARFALLDSYHGGNCAFGRLFTQANGDIEHFHRLAKDKSELQPEQRRQWLEQTCAGIAPGPEL